MREAYKVHKVAKHLDDTSWMYGIYKEPNILPRIDDDISLIFLTANQEVAESLCDELNYLAQLYLSMKEEFNVFKALHNSMCHKGKQ